MSLPFNLFALPPEGKDPSWQEVSIQKSGEITVYWFESRPFVYRDQNGTLHGIEYDLLEGFRSFLKEKYNVNLTINWKEGKSFGDTYAMIADNTDGATFAISAFSVTAQRKKQVDFSPAYMSDISVLITSDNIPILNTIDEFYEIIPDLKAVTIRQTTYEQDLKKLQREAELDFSIQYIPSTENIMRTVASLDSVFGFIDLPVYMMMFKENPSIALKRQNIMAIKREGYAMLLPKESDWNTPLSEYLNQPGFQQTLEKIIAGYIDLDLYHLLENMAQLSHDETVMLLTKEKEIQYKDLLGKTDIILKETKMRHFLITLIVITLISLTIIIQLYRKRNEQKDKIEAQRKSIALKSMELEQRNQHLIKLDEEKNNIIRILAHDLRTPISHIQGMAQIMLMEKQSLSGEQHMFVEKIVDSSVRVNKMISHLLDIDALENERVKVFLENVEVVSLLGKVTSSFEKQAIQKNITIQFESESDQCYIKAESLYLFEIFENLISNALKFSPMGKTVYVKIFKEDQIVNIKIMDEGPGLTEEDLTNLFKKYQQLSAKPTNGEASVGLGLSIVKKYVELMGGKVWCESEAGHGATFIVQFQRI